jgi:hypothetical protein
MVSRGGCRAASSGLNHQAPTSPPQGGFAGANKLQRNFNGKMPDPHAAFVWNIGIGASDDGFVYIAMSTKQSARIGFYC